jgi:hypothetical protein
VGGQSGEFGPVAAENCVMPAKAGIHDFFTALIKRFYDLE